MYKQNISIMKNIILIIAGSLLIILNSCKKLDPQLFGSLNSNTFPITVSDFTAYTIQAYEPFQAKWGYNDGTIYQACWFSPQYGNIMEFDYGTDELTTFTGWGGIFTQFSEADYTPLLSLPDNNNDHFEKVRFVSRLTEMIQTITNSSIDSTDKNEFIAECKMSRAWNMYFLLQLYGPVPVILDASKLDTSDEANLTRPARADYVADIVSDLTYAANYLPTTPTIYGRFNKGLALTVLMRTYMNEKDFSDAVQVGEQIMQMGYSLVTDYASLFTTATEQNSETIWAAICAPNSNGSNLSPGFNPWDFYTYPSDYTGKEVQYPWGFAGDAPFAATWEFYNSFDPSDKRRNLLWASYTNSSGQLMDSATGLTGPVIAKYPDNDGPAGAYQANDEPQARLADVMLMLAEALNQVNGPTAEAINYVNEVRAAHGGLGAMPSSAIANKTSFDAWILNEEGWDLYFEGDRKMELIRHGQYNQALISVGKTPTTFLEPISYYNIAASNGTLTQTPGY
jgi:starch-binding outer membrane protein, SusD/RagB family